MRDLSINLDNGSSLTNNEERNRRSVTIGLDAQGETYTNIVDGTNGESGATSPRAAIANEYKNARDALKATGKLPISIDNKCLMSMQDGRDAAHVLKLFKTACLSYAPSDLSYRDHKMTRQQMLQMRKDLIDKVNGYMQESGLHKEGAIYPRRYFDDLIMEQHLANQQSNLEQKYLQSNNPGVDEHRLKELLSPRLPFGLPSGKTIGPGSLINPNQSYKGYHQASYAANISAILSPRISQDDTHMTSIPQIKQHGIGSRFTDGSDRKLGMPAGLTLDTDSEADASKLFLREKLLNASTTRNIRNKTIDVPSLVSDYRTPRK